MKPTMKQYAVWEVDGEIGYWMMFDCMEDALDHAGDYTEIYEMNAKLLGTYKRKVSIVKSKTRAKDLTV